MPNHRTRRFRKSILILFFLYLLIIPAIYMLFDYDSFENSFKSDPLLFILEIAGIAFGIAFVLAVWTRKDPELRKW